MKNTLMTIVKIIIAGAALYAEMEIEAIRDFGNEMFDLLYITVDLSSDAASLICLTAFIVVNYLMIEGAIYIMKHTEVKIKWVSCEPKKEVKVSYMPKVAKGAN